MTDWQSVAAKRLAKIRQLERTIAEITNNIEREVGRELLIACKTHEIGRPDLIREIAKTVAERLRT